MEEEIKKALEVLRKGGIILYPTDTLWGLGCDATNAQAIDKIYKIKHKEDKLSMLVLTDNIDKLSLYVKKVPDIAWQLLEVADKPLTLILDKGIGVAENLLPEEGSIGIRVVKHEFCSKLINKLNKPLVSTSANITGKPAPKTLSEVSKEIIDSVDYCVPAKFEGNPTRKASSIIKVNESGIINIIRE